MSVSSARLAVFLLELTTRLALWYATAALEHSAPFERVIRREEAWLYSYPRTRSHVPSSFLWLLVLFLPVLAVVVDLGLSWCQRQMRRGSGGGVDDVVAAIWAFSLALGLNGLITNVLKLAVGRPRPDFLERCYGLTGGRLPSDPSAPCSGDSEVVADGRKSFPSGHSSFIFTSMTFISLYWAGRWCVPRGSGGPRPRALLLLLLLAPLLGAALVAVSRTCDYHHHWQDVLAGSVLGVCCACVSYFLYFPTDRADRVSSTGSLTYQVVSGGMSRS